MSSPSQQVAARVTLAKIDSKPAAFNTAADSTIDLVRSIYAERGGQYADTWALENLVSTFTRSTLRAIGILRSLSPEEIRLLLCAALIDMKDSRMIGPWKADSVDDGLAYRAAFREWRESYENGGARDSSTFS